MKIRKKAIDNRVILLSWKFDNFWLIGFSGHAEFCVSCVLIISCFLCFCKKETFAFGDDYYI